MIELHIIASWIIFFYSNVIGTMPPVVTQFSTDNFLECYFIFIIYKNPKKLTKFWKFKNIFFSRVNRIFSFKPCWLVLKMSSGLFRVKNVIFNHNRVYRVNTGQTMSTSFKNEFRAVSGQKRHLRPKPSSPGQYGLNHVDQV